MVARSHPPVVFGAAAAVTKPDAEGSIVDADQERLKARSGTWTLVTVLLHTEVRFLQGSSLSDRLHDSPG